MKRLILLTIILIPSAYHAIGGMSNSYRPTVTIRPRAGHADAAVVANLDQTEVEDVARVIRHLPSATPERAREDAWENLRSEIAIWMTSVGIPDGWSPPEEFLHSFVVEHPLESVEKDYGTIYVQPLEVNLSASNQDRLIEAYERELAGRRLLALAGVLAFVLTCLAAVTGYIRADEATRGYYTTPLRVTALAAVGVAGAAVYYAMTQLS